MNFTIYTEIEIASSAKVVWQHLVDLESYQHWNPFIISAKGIIAPNETLLCEPLTSDGRRYTFKPIVKKFEYEKEFSWVGNVIHPFIASGEHIFIIETLNDKTVKLIHKEIFTGLVAPLVVLFAGKKTQQGFEEMNKALKQKIENSQV